MWKVRLGFLEAKSCPHLWNFWVQCNTWHIAGNQQTVEEQPKFQSAQKKKIPSSKVRIPKSMCSTNTSALVLFKHNSNTLKLFYSSNRASIDTQGFLSCTLVSVCPELMLPISVLVPPAAHLVILSKSDEIFSLLHCSHVTWNDYTGAILIFIIVLFFLRMIIMVPPPQIKSRKFNLGTMKIFFRKNIPYNKYDYYPLRTRHTTFLQIKVATNLWSTL